MKKIIRLIARISGVEKQIEDEHRRIISTYIIETSAWFSSTEIKHRIPVFNALQYCGIVLKDRMLLDSNYMREYIDELKFDRVIDKEDYKRRIGIK